MTASITTEGIVTEHLAGGHWGPGPEDGWSCGVGGGNTSEEALQARISFQWLRQSATVSLPGAERPLPTNQELEEWASRPQNQIPRSWWEADDNPFEA